MKSAPDYYVFSKWSDAPNYAFGRRNHPGVVPSEDRDAYWRVYEELGDAAKSAFASRADADRFFLRPKQYSKDRGSRGHRPKDLWVSACAKGAELLGYMPQIYAIASERGLEVGFAASIAEDDYFDPEVKQRNRAIVPFINSKLPAPNSDVVSQLDQSLARQGGWNFNRKTRLVRGVPGFNQFRSAAD